MSKNFTLCGTSIQGTISIFPLLHQGRVFVQANDIKKIFAYPEKTFRGHLDSIVKNTSKAHMLTVGGTNTMLSNVAVDRLLTLGVAHEAAKNVKAETKAEFCDVLAQIQDSFGSKMKSVELNVNPYLHDRYLYKGMVKVVSLNQFFAEMNIPRGKFARTMSTILLESGCIDGVDFYHCDTRDIEGYVQKTNSMQTMYFLTYSGCVKITSQIVSKGYNQGFMANNLAELSNTYFSAHGKPVVEAKDVVKAIESYIKRKNTSNVALEDTAEVRADIDTANVAEREYTIGDFEKVMGYARSSFTMRSLAAYIGRTEADIAIMLRKENYIYKIDGKAGTYYYPTSAAAASGLVVNNDELFYERFQVTKKGVMKFLEIYREQNSVKLLEMKIAQ